jgi:hypothetical protein
MRNTQGGTQKWCPQCEQVRVCTAVNPSSLGERSGQRWYKRDHKDIQWFRRGLVRQSCRHEWLSAELPEAYVDELVELRAALLEIKTNAEAYSKESENAAKSLAKLSRSLSDLKALIIYKRQI